MTRGMYGGAVLRSFRGGLQMLGACNLVDHTQVARRHVYNTMAAIYSSRDTISVPGTLSAGVANARFLSQDDRGSAGMILIWTFELLSENLPLSEPVGGHKPVTVDSLAKGLEKILPELYRRIEHTYEPPKGSRKGLNERPGMFYIIHSIAEVFAGASARGEKDLRYVWGQCVEEAKRITFDKITHHEQVDPGAYALSLFMEGMLSPKWRRSLTGRTPAFQAG